MYLPEEVVSYKCPQCGELFTSERNADNCLFQHVRGRCIMHDFRYGFSLYDLNFRYNLYVPESQLELAKRITKDSCFKIPYLQGCEKPAYRIVDISIYGKIKVGGVGSWSGYYESTADWHDLKDPRPLEELFVDPRSTQGRG